MVNEALTIKGLFILFTWRVILPAYHDFARLNAPERAFFRTMANKGWVKLHRKTLENVELMNDERAFNVFMKLLLLANSKGQVAESGRDLSRLVSTKYTTLYKVLNRLENYGCISKQSSKQSYTLIAICKWNNYQTVGKHFGKQPVSTGEAHGKQLTGVPRIENNNKERLIIFGEENGRASREKVEEIRKRLLEKKIIR